MKKLFYLLLTAVLLLSTPAVYSQHSSGTQTEVIILHLNDMHAKTDGFTRLKYLADSLRRAHPFVFIVAAGDNFTGNPFVDMVADKGAPMIDLMNQAGFTVSCFGNHEFDLGQVFLQKRIAQARFPFICANINTGSTVLMQPPPYFILKAGSISIPLLGLLEINDSGIPDTHPSKVKGITFSDPLKTAGEYMQLKNKYGCLIALTHLGVETDQKLAGEYPSLDVIIGGHSHTILKKPILEKGVLIVQAGSYQRFIGKLTLIFNGNKVEEKSDTLIPVESIHGFDKAVEALAEKYDNNPEFEKVAGIASGNISGKQDLGALMTDAMTWAAKAGIAFQNKGGIRIQSLPSGDIKLKDIYRLDPFGNELILYKLSGKEIGSLLLNSYRKEKDIDLIPSGMSYTITKGGNGKPPVLNMFDLSGKPMDPDKLYTVALTSYIAAAYTFDHKDQGTSQELTTEDCLVKFLGFKHKVKYMNTARAKLKDPKGTH